jgi:hypothetical protein
MVNALPGLKSSRVTLGGPHVLVLSISKPSEVSATPGQQWPGFCFAITAPFPPPYARASPATPWDCRLATMGGGYEASGPQGALESLLGVSSNFQFLPAGPGGRVISIRGQPLALGSVWGPQNSPLVLRLR